MSNWFKIKAVLMRKTRLIKMLVSGYLLYRVRLPITRWLFKNARCPFTTRLHFRTILKMGLYQIDLNQIKSEIHDSK